MVKVYFLGSGKIAVPVLETLAASKRIELIGVGTGEDRPAGRHKALTATPVGQWAAERGRPVDKPADVNAPEFHRDSAIRRADMIFLVSFGQLLKADILTMPRFGCVNLHASLLPRHRGASPIVGAILSGETVTGISYALMEKGLDKGPVFRSFAVPLTGGETAESLERDLGALGQKTVEDVLLDIAAGALTPIPQDHDAATYDGKIQKADGVIDWSAPAERTARMVRAYYPWPGARFDIPDENGARTLLLAAATVHPELDGTPGDILRADKTAWIVACGQGALELVRVRPQGKQEMSGPDFLRGARLPNNRSLSQNKRY